MKMTIFDRARLFIDNLEKAVEGTPPETLENMEIDVLKRMDREGLLELCEEYDIENSPEHNAYAALFGFMNNLIMGEKMLNRKPKEMK